MTSQVTQASVENPVILTLHLGSARELVPVECTCIALARLPTAGTGAPVLCLSITSTSSDRLGALPTGITFAHEGT